MKNKSGFTIMELMVTLGIIAVLAASAAPPILHWLQNQKITASTQDLLVNLKKARFRAVKENARVVVAFDTTKNQYRLFIDGGNPNNTWEEATDTNLLLVDITPSVTIAAANFSGVKWVRFDGRGMPNNFGSVVLTDTRGFQSAIVVNITGSMRVVRHG